MATAGGTPLLLHHTGKSESARQYRGSSDIKAAVDCAYLIESQSGAEIRSLSLRCYKRRLTPGRTLHIAYSEADGFTRVTHTETAHAEAPAAGAQAIITAILGDGEPRNQSRMLSELQARGIAKHLALDALREAVATEIITVRTGRRNQHTYALNDVEVRV